MKWKNALLSSSMPLEFEAARFLIDQGFVVNSDFRYAWNDSDLMRDSAIDIYAKGYVSSIETEMASVQMELLVDCSHRPPDAVGLFLPDLNAHNHDMNSGKPVRMIDQFSPYVVNPNMGAFFNSELPVCYKGMEIEMKTGEVNPMIFKKGLVQLQNSLPRLMTENILNFLSGHPDENIPFMFCPVLLTTNPLYVLRKDITLNEIESASEVQEVGEQVPFLIISSDLSPDFKKRCTTECGKLKEIIRTDNAMAIEMKKARYYNSLSNLPFTIIDALIDAEYYYLNSFFSQFIICSNNQFPDFVNSLKLSADEALKTRECL